MGGSSFPRARLSRAAFLVVILLAPSSRPAAEPVRPTAGWVRGLHPAAAPQRLVSLAPSATEILFELGAGPRVVGVTRHCDRPAAALALPKIGGFADPSLEAVMALKPDAVIAVPAESNRRIVERIVDLGVPVLLAPATTLGDIRESITLFGAELGAADAATALNARIRVRLDAIASAVRGLPVPRTVILYDHRPLIVAGPGSFADEVLLLAGGRNVVEKGAVAYPTLSLEALARLAPEVVLDASMGARTKADNTLTLELLGRFPSIPAVKTGRVHALRTDVLMRPGAFIADDVEELARTLHPEAFRAPLPAAAPAAGNH